MWDQNPAPNVTAYRVFIGTAAGSYTETFDVPGGQTSFVYSTAVPGRRYYVAVATQVDHATWGPRSEEISGTAVAAQQPGPLPPLALAAPDTGAAAFASAAANGSAPATASLQVIATGLQPVSALAVSPAGVGLFVEGGHVVRVFQNPGQGLQPVPALAFADDVQIQDLALDPAFDRTGRAFLAVSRTRRGGGREVAIERHRLLGGALGESMAVVPALDGTLSGRTLLTVTRDGRVVVAQPGLVRAFAGAAPTLLGHGPVQPGSVIWDDFNQVAWLTGTSAGGGVIVERLSGTDSPGIAMPLSPGLADVVAVGEADASGQVSVAGASAAALIEFEPTTGAATILKADLAAYGTPVLVAAQTGVAASWYVVLRAGSQGGSTSDTLVRVAARSGAPRPIH